MSEDSSLGPDDIYSFFSGNIVYKKFFLGKIFKACSGKMRSTLTLKFYSDPLKNVEELCIRV